MMMMMMMVMMMLAMVVAATVVGVVGGSVCVCVCVLVCVCEALSVGISAQARCVEVAYTHTMPSIPIAFAEALLRLDEGSKGSSIRHCPWLPPSASLGQARPTGGLARGGRLPPTGGHQHFARGPSGLREANILSGLEASVLV